MPTSRLTATTATVPANGVKQPKINDASSSSQASRPSRVVRPSVSKRPTGLRGDVDNITEMDDPGYPPDSQTQLVVPPDQVKLTAEELKEEFTRVLTANNPHAPQNIVQYNYKDRAFKQLSSVDQLAVHFSMDGNMIHQESEDARKQLALGQGLAAALALRSSEANVATVIDKKEVGGVGVGPEEGEAEDELGLEKGLEEGKEGEGVEVGDDELGVGDAAPLPAAATGGEKKLTNQFNFSERASQTYNNPLREHSTMTEPPPRVTFSDNVSQWEIYDAYQEDWARQEKAKEKDKKAATGRKEDEKKKTTSSDIGGDDISTLIGPAARIIERMVNQNTYDDITQDFKYYEDGADEFRDQEGTLLPLWKFSFDKVKKLAVTCLSWSTKYMDLFAVGHGSYEFLKQSHGMILFYSLKNPSYPEYVFPTESGVMALDIHPEHPYLVAVGFYDGNVAVYNVVEDKLAPSFISTAKSGKHIDPVWQVRWQKEDLDNNNNFYSVSSDGRVVCWTILKNELHHQDVLQLQLDGVSCEGPDGTKLIALGGGTTFDFHRDKDHIFLVGTEEGQIRVCSKAISSSYLDSYESHQMAVYRVAWNPYHPHLFITCSADWSIKIWDRTTVTKDPVFTFDLGGSVGDVAWAPYSSTIFAAVTSDGRVHVYDLNINKYEAICDQLVTQKKKTKLTHIAFNPKHPIIIVGDDRGYVLSLKLSPNLRKKPKEKKVNQEPLKPEEMEAQRRDFEYQKMERILSMVRQPDPNQKKLKPPVKREP